jgi:predicted dehydrogenase
MTATRIAISGCGAVTERYYAPVLQRLGLEGRARVVAIVDPDAGRLAAVGSRFPGAARAADLAAALASGPDLVIVAAPPRFHADQACAALAAGAAVLVEKPLAPTRAEADRIAAAAGESGRLAVVAMIRRHMPAARTIRLLLAERILGAPLGFDVFEGGRFAWPVQSPAYFDRAASGGGVLLDLGAHVLDLLVWWLGLPEHVAASDDAMGGVEANALVTLACGGVAGRVRLSRDWPRPNHVTLRGTRGTVRWDTEWADRVVLTIAGAAPVTITPAGGGAEVTFLDCFAEQLRAVLDAMEGKPANVVTPEDVGPSIAALETAYRDRTPLDLPWLSERERAAARRMQPS